MKGKKAIFAEMFSWIPNLLLLAAVLFVILTLVNLYVVTNVDTKDTEVAVLVNRILYSPNGIVYSDKELERAYPGIVDLARFDETLLNNAIDLPGNRIIAAKLTLLDSNKEVKSIYFNKQWYENWAPKKYMGGPGGATKFKKSVYVLIMEQCVDPATLSTNKIEGCEAIKEINRDGLDIKEAEKAEGKEMDWAYLKNALNNGKIIFTLKPDLTLYILNLRAKGIDVEIPQEQEFIDPEDKAPAIKTTSGAHYYIPACSYIKTKLKGAEESGQKPAACYIPLGGTGNLKKGTLSFEIIVPNT